MTMKRLLRTIKSNFIDHLLTYLLIKYDEALLLFKKRSALQKTLKFIGLFYYLFF
jgi:hypothetical protein